jgi:hypothetical protein
MNPYQARFPIGSKVRVVGQARLEEFQRTWSFHNKLTVEQLQFAGKESKVVSVGYYHGGDVLYRLDAMPGVWHEECLLPAQADVQD